MQVAIIIPARYQSNRFPGKPLTPIKGASDKTKTLIARCIEAARSVPITARIIVATDDHRIANEAAANDAEVAMTSPNCRNGSERIAEAVTTLGLEADAIVNLQGDAPLTPSWFVEALIDALARDPAIGVATPVLPFEAGSLNKMQRDIAAGTRGATCAVFATNGDALYFSKQVVPLVAASDSSSRPTVFHHVGLYAYRPETLMAYAKLQSTPLEMIEGLEQLRFLESGYPIRTVQVDARGRVPWEVNNPDDVPIVEAELVALGIP